jgi:hypothetical protein
VAALPFRGASSVADSGRDDASRVARRTRGKEVSTARR